MNVVYNRFPNRIARCQAWQALIEAWKASGFSLKEFSQQQEVKAADLSRWNYRLKKKQHREAFKKTVITKAEPFIPIRLISPELKTEVTTESGIELVFAKNYCLRFRENFDEALLMRLIRVLKGVESC